MKKGFSSIHRERGQLYSTDALLSIVIFLFVLTLISGLSQQLFAQAAVEKEGFFLTQRASRSAAILFSTPGEPAFWHTLSDRNAVFAVGLTDNGVEVSPQKWSAFLDWNANDYSSLTQKMGLENENFYITISDVNKNILTRAGIAPVDKNQISVMVIPIVYASQSAVASMQVYGE